MSPRVASAAVTINEFLASNQTGLQDEDGDYSDWIELHNSGGSSVSLSGWSLSDNPGVTDKWQFPNITIGPGAYRIIFASNKNRSPLSGELHTNFKLEKSGEYLTLFNSGVPVPGGTFNPEYPKQQTDFSYGVRAGFAGYRYLDTPTPGAGNVGGSSYEGLAGKVTFSRTAGLFANAFQLTLSSTDPSTQFRYTTDGSLPTLSSPFYAGPIPVTVSTLVRVLPTGPNLVPGKVKSRGFIKLASNMTDFSSNLPIIIFDSFGYDIDAESGVENDRPIWPFRPVYTVIIDVGQNGRAHVLDTPDYVGRAGMKVRGNSSQGLAKKQYAVEMWNEDDEDKDVPLLGFPAESDWVLHAPYGDKSLMRNYLAYNWARDLGIHAMRAQFAEVFFNSDSGQVALDMSSSGDYRGVYVFIEKIKRGENRVAISGLDPADTAEPDVTGGYIVAMDIMDDNEQAIGWQTSRGNPPWYNWNGFVPNEPGKDDIEPAQLTYIKGYINDFEAALYAPNFDDLSLGYRQFGDVGTFVDFHLYTELLMNADSYYGSMFMNKDRLGKLRMGPLWDWNVSLGGTSDWNVPNPTAWHYDRVGGGVFWFERLIQDPAYRLLFADKYYVWRHNSWTNSKLIGDVVATAAILEEAQQRNFTRWPILGQFISPAEQLNYGDWASRTEYQDEIDYLTNWITTRMNWLDTNVSSDHAPAPPTFSQQGGEVAPGFSVTITANGPGTVYYTTDGSDPYQHPTASYISASTTLFTNSAAKRALIPTIGNPADATWRSNLAYNESGWLSGNGGVGYENDTGYETFIGFDVDSQMDNVNTSCYIRIPFTADTAALAGYNTLTLRMRWDDGFIAYLNGTKIAEMDAPGSPAWNSAATDADEEASSVWLEYDVSAYLGTLNNGSNLLAIHGLNELLTSSDFLISTELVAKVVEAGNPGGVSPSALVYSAPIVISEPMALQTRRLNSGDWSALNVATFETPGILGVLRITEIMYHPEVGGAEYIELQNIGSYAINISGAYFSDGISFTFPANTVLQPGEHIVLVATEDAAAFTAQYPGVEVLGYYTSSLSNGGETVTINASDGTVLHSVTYNDASPWPTSADGLGFSLVIVDPSADPNDPANWRGSTNVGGSPGASVAPPGIAAVLVNEALTHTDLPDVDVVEIYNPTSAPVDLGGWFLTDDRLEPHKAEIPDTGAYVVPVGGYLAIDKTVFGPGAATPGFLLNSHGGEGIYIYSGDGVGNITGYSHGYNFGPAENGVSFGRYISVSGFEHFVAQTTNTLGSANAGPKIGPLVVTEIYYNPADDDLEYVELTNISGADIQAWDIRPGGEPNNTYFINGIRYNFPVNFTIPGGARILIVNSSNPGDYGTPFGPFGGDSKLDNGGETLSVKWPDKPDVDFVPLIIMDKVTYDDDSPWPNADGNGLALRRIEPGQFGNDYANWAAVTPSYQLGGMPPSAITFWPTTPFAIEGEEFALALNVDTITGALWTRNGLSINAKTLNAPGDTDTQITFTPLGYGDVGVYCVTGLSGVEEINECYTLYYGDILPAGTTLPVRSLLGLTLLSALTALAGAHTLRRHQAR